MKLREGYPFTRRIIQRHPDLTIFMRSKLLNWLFEVESQASYSISNYYFTGYATFQTAERDSLFGSALH